VGQNHYKINHSHSNAIIDVSALLRCGAASHPRSTDNTSTPLQEVKNVQCRDCLHSVAGELSMFKPHIRLFVNLQKTDEMAMV
jgi:hypothetical protein